MSEIPYEDLSKQDQILEDKRRLIALFPDSPGRYMNNIQSAFRLGKMWQALEDKPHEYRR